MQLARLAVSSQSSVIRNPVGSVGILLYFSDKYALTYRVERTCLYEELTDLNSVFIQRGSVFFCFYINKKCTLGIGENIIKRIHNLNLIL